MRISKKAVSDLVEQYQRTFHMLSEEINRFDDRQWLVGLSGYLTPVNIALHIYDCLDYYFSGKTGDDYRWGYRFGGGFWELPVERLPGKAALLEYAREVEQHTLSALAALEDADLAKPFPVQDGSGETHLGHAIYALRHTVHHHGELAALATFHGHEGGSWQ